MSIQSLIETMDRLVQIHLFLLDLSEQKKDVLIKNQVEKLNKIVNKETSLIKEIIQLDKQRIEYISEFLVQKGYRPNPSITVSDLIKLVVAIEDKRAIEEKQKALLGAIFKLKKLNQLNVQLIEHSLAFIEYSLDIVLGPPEDNMIYHKPSLQQSTKRSGVFDSRV
jgi:flagellar biosynthesis/type III secretory pathway chaperone